MGFDSGGGGGAPTDASYVTTASEGDLSNETVASKPGDLGDDTFRVFGANTDFQLGFDSASGNLQVRNSAGTVLLEVDANGQLLGTGATWDVGTDPSVIRGNNDTGDVRFSSGINSNAELRDRFGNPTIGGGRNTGTIEFNGNRPQGWASNDTNDSMTADPETAMESGFVEVVIGGTVRQIPFYDA